MPLVPAKAGTQFLAKRWMPAFAGMSGMLHLQSTCAMRGCGVSTTQK